MNFSKSFKKTFYTLDVPRAKFSDRPISCNENPYIGTYKRNHSGDYRCQKDEVVLLIRNSFKILDNEVLEKFTFEEDIDKETFKGYRNIYNNTKKNHPWSKLDDKDFLQQIGGMAKDKETGKVWITGAGLLMFGKFNSIKSIYPNYYLDYFDKSLGNSERWDDRVTYDGTCGEGNLFNFYFTVIRKLNQNLKVPFKIAEDGFTRVEETSAHIAIREAFVNAIVHADYKGEAALKVIMYSDRYEFYNPGLLRISKEDIYHGGHSYPRNATIMSMLNYINICERAGSGFPKILSAVKEYNWKMPEIEENQSLNLIRFTVWTESVGECRRVSESVGECRRVSGQEEEILRYLENNFQITRREIEELIGVGESRARMILQKMVEKELIKKVGASSKTAYAKVEK